MMESLRIARDLYGATAEEVDGGRLSAFTGELKEVAAALENPKVLPQVLKGHTDEISMPALEDAATHLREGAGHLEQTMGQVNPQMEDLPDGVAGQAYLGQQGTETVDPFAPLNTQGQGNLIDVEMAKGVAEHEKFHVGQKEPDAEVAGVNVTAHEFIEAGAIAAQLKVAPQSFNKLSLKYQSLYRKVLSLMSDSERVMELSRAGKLQQFAKEVGSTKYALAA